MKMGRIMRAPHGQHTSSASAYVSAQYTGRGSSCPLNFLPLTPANPCGPWRLGGRWQVMICQRFQVYTYIHMIWVLEKCRRSSRKKAANRPKVAASLLLPRDPLPRRSYCRLCGPIRHRWDGRVGKNGALWGMFRQSAPSGPTQLPGCTASDREPMSGCRAPPRRRALAEGAGW